MSYDSICPMIRQNTFHWSRDRALGGCTFLGCDFLG